jgi:cobalt-zinc-cadmium efflux system protein
MTRGRRLTVVLALNLVLVTGLVLVGLTAHSLGVLAAGADYLADAAAIGVSLLAIGLSTRPPTPGRQRGFPRATAIAASVNGGWLLILSLLVMAGAVDRLATGTPHVDGLPVLIVSAIASAVMVVGVVILGGDADSDADDGAGALNMRAVALDTAADAAAAAGVAFTGGVILATGGLYWLDPTVALAIAMVVGYHALALLRDVVRMLRRPPVATRPEASSD